MSDDVDDASKTEEATPEKLKKSREEGQFPRSRDATTLAATIAVFLVIVGMGPTFATTVSEFSTRCFGLMDGYAEGDWGRVFKDLALALAVLMLPMALAAAVGGTAMGFIQAGFQPRLELAAPKWSRIDPASKLKGMLSPKSAVVETALSLGRVVVVAAVTYWVLSDEYETIVGIGRVSLRAGVRTAIEMTSKVALASLMCLVVMSILDYVNAWMRHNQQMRMTRQEVKDEHHQQEGDPRVRARQRQRARDMARRGIAQEVKKSAVVIANPTHISVALRYSPEEGVPVVAAKGYDEVALYIRKLAVGYRIPVIENRPLARALASQVRLGRTIPGDLYTAVAEVLATVYRLRNRLGK